MDGIEGGRQQGAANAAPPNGVNGLVQMALIILSAVPNSAATERVFCQFGIIHSKYRNRMHPDKVRKITLVKADIAREFGIPKRSKQKFASLADFEQDDNNEANPSSPSTSTPSAHPPPQHLFMPHLPQHPRLTTMTRLHRLFLISISSSPLQESSWRKLETKMTRPKTNHKHLRQQPRANHRLPHLLRRPMMIRCLSLLFSTIRTRRPSLQRHGSLWLNFGGVERRGCVMKRYFMSLSMRILQNPVLQVHDTLLSFALKSLIT